jgi:hypothetical protein
VVATAGMADHYDTSLIVISLTITRTIKTADLYSSFIVGRLLKSERQITKNSTVTAATKFKRLLNNERLR